MTRGFERTSTVLLAVLLVTSAFGGVLVVPGTASGIQSPEVVSPTDRTVLTSGESLAVEYRHNVTDAESVTVRLVSDEGRTYRYEVDENRSATNRSETNRSGSNGTATDRTVTATLDLDRPAERSDGRDRAVPLVDDQYALSVTVTDAQGRSVSSSSTAELVVVDDEPPTVELADIGRTDDVAPGETVNVSVHVADASNVTSLAVSMRRNGSVVAKEPFDVDFAPGEDDGTTLTRQFTVSRSVADNADYELEVSATDENGNVGLNGTEPGAFDVNAERPRLVSVEATPGFANATVTFSEPVVAGDGTIGADEFAYHDRNGAGASLIRNATALNATAVELEFDAAVEPAALGTDAVSVRKRIQDLDGENARTVPRGESVTLRDGTAPAGITYSADPAVNVTTVENYSVGVATDGEVVDATVTISDGNRSVTARSEAASTHDFGLNLTALADGQTNLTWTVADPGGNVVNHTETVPKDTVRPTIVATEANVSSTVLHVSFSEPVTGVVPSAFGVTDSNYSIAAAAPLDPTRTLLVLSQPIEGSALDSDDVQVNASGVTDAVGNSPSEAARIRDTTAPVVDDVDVEPNGSNVTLAFNEPITSANGTAISTAAVAYSDANGAGAAGVENVSQPDESTLVVTLDAGATPHDIANDALVLESGTIADLADNTAPERTVSLSRAGVTALDARASGSTVTVTVVAPSNLSATLSGPVSLTEKNREFTASEGFELEDRFATTLERSDFTEVQSGVYEASVDVPEDGAYVASGPLDGTENESEAVVDTATPRLTDAVILSVTDQAQIDDSRNTTRVRVRFSEPIDGSALAPSDVRIDGFDGSVVAVQDAGPFGAVEVVLKGHLSTGDHPDVWLDPDGYVDLAGTPGANDSATTVHTDVLDLQEGTNFVSVPAASGSFSADEFDHSKLEAIFAYDAEDDDWLTYDPDALLNDFDSLEGGRGYIVVMDAPDTVPVTVRNTPDGEAPPNSVELSEGYNLIGHYQEDQQPVETALASVTAGNRGNFTDTVVRLFRQSPGATGLEYDSYSSGGLVALDRGEAYWAFVSDDEVYTETPFTRD